MSTFGVILCAPSYFGAHLPAAHGPARGSSAHLSTAIDRLTGPRNDYGELIVPFGRRGPLVYSHVDERVFAGRGAALVSRGPNLLAGHYRQVALFQSSLGKTLAAAAMSGRPGRYWRPGERYAQITGCVLPCRPVCV